MPEDHTPLRQVQEALAAVLRSDAAERAGISQVAYKGDRSTEGYLQFTDGTVFLTTTGAPGVRVPIGETNLHWPPPGSYAMTILNAFIGNLDGIIDEELGDVLPGRYPGTQAKARKRLVDLGWVRDSGEKRRPPDRYGSKQRAQIVWELTPRARRQLEYVGS